MKITKSRKAYFEAAKAMAKLSDFHRTSVGCVAVYKHHIISSGFNSEKTDPTQRKYNIYRFSEDTPASIHAETSCLKPLLDRKDIDFKHVELYVYRIGKSKANKMALARPCPSCFQLIKDLGIRNIFYTNCGGFSHEEILY